MKNKRGRHKSVMNYSMVLSVLSITSLVLTLKKPRTHHLKAENLLLKKYFGWILPNHQLPTEKHETLQTICLKKQILHFSYEIVDGSQCPKQNFFDINSYRTQNTLFES